MITPEMLITARIGLAMIALSLFINLFYFSQATSLKNRFLFYSILVLLALKITVQTLSVFPTNFWIGVHGLHILYLHLVMLGFITITFIHILPFSKKPSPVLSSLFVMSVWLLLLSLIAISGFWPASLTVPNVFFWTFLIALLPLIPLLLLLFKPIFRTDNFQIFNE